MNLVRQHLEKLFLVDVEQIAVLQVVESLSFEPVSNIPMQFIYLSQLSLKLHKLIEFRYRPKPVCFELSQILIRSK